MRRSGLVIRVVLGCLSIVTGANLIDIDKVGGYLLPIALPRLKGETVDPVLGQQIRTVMQRDLERTGLFRIIESNSNSVRTIKTFTLWRLVESGGCGRYRRST